MKSMRQLVFFSLYIRAAVVLTLGFYEALTKAFAAKPPA